MHATFNLERILTIGRVLSKKDRGYVATLAFDDLKAREISFDPELAMDWVNFTCWFLLPTFKFGPFNRRHLHR